MSLEEQIAMLEELMDLEEGTLTKESQLNEFEEWDSLSKLALMAEAKKTYGKRLTVSELNEFKTVEDVCSFLNQ